MGWARYPRDSILRQTARTCSSVACACMTTNMSHLLKGLSLSLVRSGSKPGYAWVVSQFAPWSKDLLCVLCESLAFFAVKFFFTAKLATNCRQERKANHAPSETEPLLSAGPPS